MNTAAGKNHQKGPNLQHLTSLVMDWMTITHAPATNSLTLPDLLQILLLLPLKYLWKFYQEQIALINLQNSRKKAASFLYGLVQ